MLRFISERLHTISLRNELTNSGRRGDAQRDLQKWTGLKLFESFEKRS